MDGTAVAGAFSATSAHFLGTGTYGETWCVRGLDAEAGDYAVKLLKPEFFNPARVQREIQGLQRFDHPGIVRLIEVRTVEIEREPRTALVCEYIQGGSVQDALNLGALPSKKEAKKFARGILEAVAELHGAETIHRDIKPTNVLVTLHEGAGVPKVIDFGVAKATGQQLTDKTLFTQFAQMVGTPLYMSPEQAEMTSVDVDTMKTVATFAA